MSKIGIFGGTFNPIHNGHVSLGVYCKDELSLDKLMLIPTYTPPHKSSSELAEEEHRVNMCKLATEQYGYFEVSDIEIERKGKSYTYETLNSLKEIYTEDELYLIVGADMFLTLDKWKNPQSIFKNATIVAVPRNDDDKNDLVYYYDNTIKKLGAEAIVLENPVVQVSSTYIRENIDNYQLIKSLIDSNVYEYIVKNKLYRK